MLEKQIFNFLKTHRDPEKPFLLALSGGPDSLTLFYILREMGFSFAVAHVDHRWRVSSEVEARQLQKMVENEGRIFHLKVLSSKILKGNLESVCRDERITFFQDLCAQHGYQAVLLGHHADDQAETVLKRIFEGSSLGGIVGLKPVTQMPGLTIWRPLLDIPKKEILGWLTQHSHTAFWDETNEDTRFIRARLREHIIPNLAKAFGKEIRFNLNGLAKEAHEWISYLNERVKNYLNIVEGPFGWMLDLRKEHPQSIMELKHVIRCFCTRAKLTLSRESLQRATELLSSGSANKAVSSGKNFLWIDRFCLFAFHSVEDCPKVSLLLQPGEQMFGPWVVTVQEAREHPLASDWTSAWEGQMHVLIEKGSYFLQLPTVEMNSSLSKWWGNHKVPVCLRSLFPVLTELDGSIAHEFLSGRPLEPSVGIDLIQITLKR